VQNRTRAGAAREDKGASERRRRQQRTGRVATAVEVESGERGGGGVEECAWAGAVKGRDGEGWCGRWEGAAATAV